MLNSLLKKIKKKYLFMASVFLFYQAVNPESILGWIGSGAAVVLMLVDPDK